MAPIPPSSVPRIVVYHQTHHTQDDEHVPLLPLVTPPTGPLITHLILAAIHLNDPPGNITLNDHPPTHPRNHTLWAELSVLRAFGVKTLGMLGGAAKGSFTRLDHDDQTFELYYIPLRDLIREKQLDGLDLDVEEEMALAGVIRLIDRLKLDFGDDFLITLAPVAAALMSNLPEHNLSGFDYEALEVMRGHKIAWYNTQFYCGWGDLRNTRGFDTIVTRGFQPSKVVLGMVTNPENGSGWVSFEVLQDLFRNLRNRYGNAFGGVMGWEYFNSLPGKKDRPWEWAELMTKYLRIPTMPAVVDKSQTAVAAEAIVSMNVADGDNREEAPLPESFEYFTDESADE